MIRPKLKGIFPATFTPFKEDKSVDYEKIEPYFDFLYKNGIRGIFLNGSSGEWNTLSMVERKKILELWMEKKKEDFKIIVHVADLCFDNARDLAKHAQDCGVDGVASIGSLYFKAANEKILARNTAAIASATPELPFYYYHIPELTGIHLMMRDYVREALKIIPNFSGIKFSWHDFMDFSNMAQATRNIEGFTLFSGFDQMLLQFRTYGSHAAVGTTFNHAAPIYHKIWESYENGDIKTAQEYQELSVRMIEVFEDATSFIGANKVVMEKIGMDVGEPRLPISSLPNEEKEHVWKLLEERDVPKYLSKL